MIQLQSTNQTMFDSIIKQDFEDQIYNSFKQYYEDNKQKMSLVLTGPATNIAYTIQKHDDFCDYVQEVVLMGGGIGLGNVTKYAEYNVWSDPAALNFLFS